MKLTDILKAVSALASIVPALVAVIKEVEGHAAGPDKKSAVLAFLDVLLAGVSGFTGELTPALKDAIRAVASVVVDGVVTAFNVIGLFKKAAPAS